MPGLFQGLEIGKRALLTHQVSLQTIGHNIANVNTPGYTRQRVLTSSSLPEQNANGVYGSGVQVDDVRQIRDLFLGQQYREATKQFGSWGYQEKTLQQIESLFNEPQDSSMGALMDKFWDAWSELSNNTDSSNNRRIVITEAEQLVNGFQRLSRQLSELRDATDRDLSTMTNEVNRLTSEIAQINQQIKAAELGDNTANDLRDRRDQLTEQLAGIIDARVLEKPNGATIVTMGAMVLVDEDDSFAIGTKSSVKNGQMTNQLVWANTSVNLRNLSGQLAGLTEMRDKTIPDYIAQLDELANHVIDQVNGIHQNGFGLNGSTGVLFFDPAYRTAATMRLSPDVINDINKIATGGSASGGNEIALAIAELRTKAVLDGNSRTLNDYYNSMVGGLGVETRQASSFTANYELLLQQTEQARQAVQGVSLDEEMANLIKFQHAYDAAARVITSMDEALQTVIADMGVVGR